MTLRAPRRAVVAAAAMALVSLAALAALAGRPREPRLPAYGPAPAFVLVDQAGREVRGEDLRGRVVLANFVYTSCPDVCPMLTARMAEVRSRLRERGLLGSDVRLLSFTVDPARDTPEVLARYAARFDADGEAWRFLTGSPEAVRALLVEGFRLGLQPAPAGHGGHAPHGGGTITHSNRFVLIDRGGRIRAYYDGRELDAETVLRDVREVAG
jgi:protein SCO1